MNFLRLHVLPPPIAKHVFSLDAVRKFAFPLVSQIGINYHSSLSQHAGDEDFEVKAGDRMPYFLVDGQSVYESMRQPKFHLVTFSNDRRNFQTLKSELETDYSEIVDFGAFPITHDLEKAFGSQRDLLCY